jgi:hypothetical protein
MHPQISWELFADPVGSLEHTLGTTGLEVPFFSGEETWLFQSLHNLWREFIFIVFFNHTPNFYNTDYSLLQMMYRHIDIINSAAICRSPTKLDIVITASCIQLPVIAAVVFSDHGKEREM